jgi:hypothetical protein
MVIVELLISLLDFGLTVLATAARAGVAARRCGVCDDLYGVGDAQKVRPSYR